MSNHARRHRAYTPPAPRLVMSMSNGIDKHEHLRQHLTAVGCTCHPDISFTIDDNGNEHAHVAHDSWCHLLARIDAGSN